MKKILTIQNLNAGYEGTPVLHNIDLTIYDRDFIGVIGPNGGGKTTLIKVIMGILKPFSGKVIYNLGENKDFRKSLGYLPQQNSIDKKFPISIREVVLSGLMSSKNLLGVYKKDDYHKADEILHKFGLGEITGKAVGELSGGQLQRLFLARAIISSPQLLILDEPDSFVDNRFEHELYQILKELNEKMAILLVSHDIGTISSYIKSIACVNGSLHYHNSNMISSEQLKVFNCPVDIIAHGPVPHRVLHHHHEK